MHARARPQAVVLRKRDFLDLDNPLLAWMLDYDAVSAVLKSMPAFKVRGACVGAHARAPSTVRTLGAWRRWQLCIARARARVPTHAHRAPCTTPQALKQEQMEHIFDRFEARQELWQGDVILGAGAPVSVLAV
jgi:hypothetical protein